MDVSLNSTADQADMLQDEHTSTEAITITEHQLTPLSTPHKLDASTPLLPPKPCIPPGGQGACVSHPPGGYQSPLTSQIHPPTTCRASTMRPPPPGSSQDSLATTSPDTHSANSTTLPSGSSQSIVISACPQYGYKICGDNIDKSVSTAGICALISRPSHCTTFTCMR